MGNAGFFHHLDKRCFQLAGIDFISCAIKEHIIVFRNVPDLVPSCEEVQDGAIDRNGSGFPGLFSDRLDCPSCHIDIFPLEFKDLFLAQTCVQGKYNQV